MKLALFFLVAGFTVVTSCNWTQEDTDNLVAAILGGSITGVVIGLVMTVLASLPLCCGVMKEKGKQIATTAMINGIVVCFIPAITGFVVGASIVDKMCDRCGTCSDADKEAAQTHVGVAGVIVAYVHGFGWLALILGITAASLSCCICCNCCKMKNVPVATSGSGPVVIGQAVSAP